MARRLARFQNYCICEARVERRLRGCYKTVSSPGDSGVFFHCTQHFAFGCVLGCHESAPAALVLAALFHRCNNEPSFVTDSLAPRPDGKKVVRYFKVAHYQKSRLRR